MGVLNGIPPVGRAVECGSTKSSRDKRRTPQDRADGFARTLSARRSEADSVHFDPDGMSRRPVRLPQEEPDELEKCLRMMEANNRQIAKSAEKIRNAMPQLTVPSVVGLPLRAAAGRLKESELSVAQVIQSYHGTLPVVHVISQEPEAGSAVASSTGVTLVVSKGPSPL